MPRTVTRSYSFNMELGSLAPGHLPGSYEESAKNRGCMQALRSLTSACHLPTHSESSTCQMQRQRWKGSLIARFISCPGQDVIARIRREPTISWYHTCSWQDFWKHVGVEQRRGKWWLRCKKPSVIPHALLCEHADIPGPKYLVASETHCWSLLCTLETQSHQSFSLLPPTLIFIPPGKLAGDVCVVQNSGSDISRCLTGKLA